MPAVLRIRNIKKLLNYVNVPLIQIYLLLTSSQLSLVVKHSGQDANVPVIQWVHLPLQMFSSLDKLAVKAKVPAPAYRPKKQMAAIARAEMLVESFEPAEVVCAGLLPWFPVEPEPVEPDPVEPDPVEPDPVEPDPVEPDPVEPDPVEPDPVEPDPVEPDPVEPDPVELLEGVEPVPDEPVDLDDPVEPVEPDPVDPVDGEPLKMIH